MQKIFITILAIVTRVLCLQAQPVMDVEGSIKVGNNTEIDPEPGTMRWSGSDFEVWNGVLWASLTGNKEVGTVEDRDGNVYKTIRIGSQVWMAENLRVTQYNDGMTIDQITNPVTWSDLSTGAWCYYDNNAANNIPYGKLYNWYAGNTENLCPTGWHVPSFAEWTTLTDYLGGTGMAGGKMKEMGTTHWNSPNTGATNESGFSGLPGGRRIKFGDFGNVGLRGYWWSSTEGGSGPGLRYNDGVAHPVGSDNWFGFSVRCVRDD